MLVNFYLYICLGPMGPRYFYVFLRGAWPLEAPRLAPALRESKNEIPPGLHRINTCVQLDLLWPGQVEPTFHYFC